MSMLSERDAAWRETLTREVVRSAGTRLVCEGECGFEVSSIADIRQRVPTSVVLDPGILIICNRHHRRHGAGAG